ncbi:MetQ/NlpA family ABC transporter substrate-binding protein [Bacillus sp. V3B]|uniref:MetQ/NlpA family ABC transporter substrate-binding protein n=1 Tax=Bacillus sp. V3B TaxID=2804915 RepID=UPI00210A8254|nr:MetQ/NlpA family ABC transporter substrate-binding protein [Bacillus sp. V3B]MCQ6275615.1 MetQ/NlpA family ABC transporter substrate-binding protein [Bacillus sp. V3B]
MKKWLSLLFSLSFVLFLTACGGGSDDNKLVIGATNVPHAEILEEAKPLLEEKGIELEIETFTDYVLPNQALESKDLDANYFQHIQYFEGQKKDHEYDFVNAGGIHFEPIGIYSKKYKTLDELPDKAKVILSSSVADHGRVLSLLEKEGLITLKDGVDKESATIEDIAENKKNLDFDPNYEAKLLPEIYDNGEGDIVIINSNYAMEYGINPIEDSIALEDTENNPYINIIAVRSEDESKEEIKTLVEVLHSKEIQDWILEKYNGAVVPVTE